MKISSSVLFAALALHATGIAAASIPLSKEVNDLVRPVVDAFFLVLKRDDMKNESNLQEKLTPILDTKNATTDEALSVLLGIYLGEGSGEEIECELVNRGKAILPLLRKYTNAQVAISGVDTSKLHPSNGLYTSVEKRIRNGERCEWQQ
jgi:hypothetical protein